MYAKVVLCKTISSTTAGMERFNVITLNENEEMYWENKKAEVTEGQVEKLSESEQRRAKRLKKKHFTRATKLRQNARNPVLLSQRSRVGYKGKIGVMKKPMRRGDSYAHVEFDGGGEENIHNGVL